MTSYSYFANSEVQISKLCIKGDELVHMLVETRSVAHEIAFTGSKSQKIRHRARMSM